MLLPMVFGESKLVIANNIDGVLCASLLGMQC